MVSQSNTVEDFPAFDSNFPILDPDTLLIKLHNYQKEEYLKLRGGQNKKFQKFLDNFRNETKSSPLEFQTDSVVNLSARKLTVTQQKVLAGCLSFSPALPGLPFKDYIVATEIYIQNNELMTTTQLSFEIKWFTR